MARRKTEVCSILGRVSRRSLPPGSEVTIAAIAANALRYEMQRHDLAEPVYAVIVPTTVRVGVLVNGETRWCEVDSNNSGDIFRAIDALVEETVSC